MTSRAWRRFDERLDLVLKRELSVPRRLVWKAWTEPEHMVHWFTPGPWGTKSIDLELRPGGAFAVVMLDPEGKAVGGEEDAGCVLEVVPEQRFVWTSALGPGYRPLPEREGGLPFTAIIDLEGDGGGTLYTATAVHRTVAERDRHDEMGFTLGWGAALDQLVAYVKSAML